ncbi:transcriptional regulator [Caballeronia hypogeia]|uniref:Transcriptional regulator n=1 Tax=Caballeronia hypogeia TaxID=1777140 RepID=A0A157Z861_9BURK|nr:hypothetical protein [Caballeronia hypogeia]SAK41748.1 transcriptional regulator [Caballeronia hypogeia]
MVERNKLAQESLRERILEICREKYVSLGEICLVLDMNKNTIRAGYIYPMVKEGMLMQEQPPGTKNSQRYKARKRKK